MVSMYTVYNDLFRKMSQENLTIQNYRDNIIRKAMLERKFPKFPIDEYDVGNLFPFFKQITHQNPFLNIILLYNLNGKDCSAMIIRNNQIHMYPNKEEAFDSIIKMGTKEMISHSLL